MSIFRHFGKREQTGPQCAMCRTAIMGEEKVIEMQRQALYVHRNPHQAQKIEQKSSCHCRPGGNSAWTAWRKRPRATPTAASPARAAAPVLRPCTDRQANQGELK